MNSYIIDTFTADDTKWRDRNTRTNYEITVNYHNYLRICQLYLCSGVVRGQGARGPGDQGARGPGGQGVRGSGGKGARGQGGQGVRGQGGQGARGQGGKGVMAPIPQNYEW